MATKKAPVTFGGLPEVDYNGYDEWLKQQNPNYTGQQAYQQTMANNGELVRGGDTKDNGFFGTMKDSADAGFFSSLAGTARFAGEFAPIGNETLNNVADYLDKRAAYNTPTEEPTGANYVAGAIGNAIGSGGAAMVQAAVAIGIGKALGLGAAAVGIGRGTAAIVEGTGALSKMSGLVSRMWSTPFGKLALGEVAGSPFEATAEAGNLITEMRQEGFNDDEIREAALKSAGYNMAWLTVANILEAGVEAKIAKGFAKQGAKGIANKTIMDTVDNTWKTAGKRGLAGAGFGALSEGGEEFGQNLIGNVAKGEELNYDDATEAAIQGAIGGAFLKGTGTFGHVKLGDGRKNFVSDGKHFEASDVYDLNGQKVRDYTVDGQEVSADQFLQEAGVEGGEYGLDRKSYAQAVLQREIAALSDGRDERSKASMERILASGDTERMWQAAKKADGMFTEEPLFKAKASELAKQKLVQEEQDKLRQEIAEEESEIQGETIDDIGEPQRGYRGSAVTDADQTMVENPDLVMGGTNDGNATYLKNTKRRKDLFNTLSNVLATKHYNGKEIGSEQLKILENMLSKVIQKDDKGNIKKDRNGQTVYNYYPANFNFGEMLTLARKIGIKTEPISNTQNTSSNIGTPNLTTPDKGDGLTEAQRQAQTEMSAMPTLRRQLANISLAGTINGNPLTQEQKDMIHQAVKSGSKDLMLRVANELGIEPDTTTALEQTLRKAYNGSEKAKEQLKKWNVSQDAIDTAFARFKAEDEARKNGTPINPEPSPKPAPVDNPVETPIINEPIVEQPVEKPAERPKGNGKDWTLEMFAAEQEYLVNEVRQKGGKTLNRKQIGGKLNLNDIITDFNNKVLRSSHSDKTKKKLKKDFAAAIHEANVEYAKNNPKGSKGEGATTTTEPTEKPIKGGNPDETITSPPQTPSEIGTGAPNQNPDSKPEPIKTPNSGDEGKGESGQTEQISYPQKIGNETLRHPKKSDHPAAYWKNTGLAPNDIAIYGEWQIMHKGDKFLTTREIDGSIDVDARGSFDTVEEAVAFIEQKMTGKKPVVEPVVETPTTPTVTPIAEPIVETPIEPTEEPITPTEEPVQPIAEPVKPTKPTKPSKPVETDAERNERIAKATDEKFANYNVAKAIANAPKEIRQKLQDLKAELDDIVNGENGLANSEIKDYSLDEALKDMNDTINKVFKEEPLSLTKIAKDKIVAAYDKSLRAKEKKRQEAAVKAGKAKGFSKNFSKYITQKGISEDSFEFKLLTSPCKITSVEFTGVFDKNRILKSNKITPETTWVEAIELANIDSNYELGDLVSAFAVKKFENDLDSQKAIFGYIDYLDELEDTDEVDIGITGQPIVGDSGTTPKDGVATPNGFTEGTTPKGDGKPETKTPEIKVGQPQNGTTNPNDSGANVGRKGGNPKGNTEELTATGNVQDPTTNTGTSIGNGEDIGKKNKPKVDEWFRRLFPGQTPESETDGVGREREESSAERLERIRNTYLQGLGIDSTDSQDDVVKMLDEQVGNNIGDQPNITLAELGLEHYQDDNINDLIEDVHKDKGIDTSDMFSDYVEWLQNMGEELDNVENTEEVDENISDDEIESLKTKDIYDAVEFITNDENEFTADDVREYVDSLEPVDRPEFYKALKKQLAEDCSNDLDITDGKASDPENYSLTDQLNDFTTAIGERAKELGLPEEYEDYLTDISNRSTLWRSIKDNDGSVGYVDVDDVEPPKKKHKLKLQTATPTERVMLQQRNGVQRKSVLTPQETTKYVDKVKNLLHAVKVQEYDDGIFIYTLPNGDNLLLDLTTDSASLIGELSEEEKTELAKAAGEGELVGAAGFNANERRTEFGGKEVRTIHLTDLVNEDTPTHEVMHLAYDLYTTNEEKRILRNYAIKQLKTELKDIYGNKWESIYNKMTPQERMSRCEEIIADGLVEYIANENVGSAIRKIARKILRALARWANELGVHSKTGIYESVKKGDVFNREHPQAERLMNKIKAQVVGTRENKNLNNELFDKAKKMKDDGKDMRNIFIATGFFEDVDGKWKTWIDDNYDNFDYSKLPNVDGQEITFGGIYNNPDLFAAYPELKDIKLIGREMQGGLQGQTNGRESLEFRINRDSLKDIEMQKKYPNMLIEMDGVEYKFDGVNYWSKSWDLISIGKAEELAKGEIGIETILEPLQTDLKFYQEAVDSKDENTEYWKKRLNETKAEIEKIKKLKIKKITTEEILDNDKKEVCDTVFHEMQHIIQDMEGFASGGSSRTINFFINNRIDHIDKAIKLLNNYDKEIKKLEKSLAQNEQYLKEYSDPNNRYYDPQKAEDYKKYVANDKQFLERAKNYGPKVQNKDAEIKRLEKEKADLEKVQRDIQDDFEKYQHLHGEQEARRAGKFGTEKTHYYSTSEMINFAVEKMKESNCFKALSKKTQATLIANVRRESRMAFSAWTTHAVSYNRPEHLTAYGKNSIAGITEQYNMSNAIDVAFQALEDLAVKNLDIAAEVLGQKEIYSIIIGGEEHSTQYMPIYKETKTNAENNTIEQRTRKNLKLQAVAAPTSQTLLERARVTRSSQGESFTANIENIKKEPIKYIKEKLKEIFKKLYRDWVDRNYYFELLDKDVATKLKRNLDEAEKTYNKMHGINYKSAGMADGLLLGGKDEYDAMNERLTNVKMRHKNGTMAQVMDNIADDKLDSNSKTFIEKYGFKDSVEALGEALTWRRLKELYRLHKEAHDEWEQNGKKGEEPTMRNIPNDLTERELDQLISTIPSQFQNACKDYYAMNDNILCILEDAGVISKSLHDVLNKHKDYCPLQRDFSDTAGMDSYLQSFNAGGSGAANVSNSIIKHMTKQGSKRTVINPLETTVAAVHMATRRAERNKAALHFVSLAKLKDDNGNPLMGDVVEPRWHWAKSPAEIKKGEKIVDANGKVVGVMVKDTARMEDSTFSVMEDGVKKTYWCNPMYYEDLVGENADTSGMIWNFMSVFAKVLRFTATKSPSFIIRNGIRDTFTAATSTDIGFKPIVGSIEGLKLLHKKEQNLTADEKKLLARFRVSGISTRGRLNDGQEIYKSLQDMVQDKKIDFNNPLETAKLLWQYYDDENTKVEQAPRIKLLELKLKENKSKVLNRPLTKEEKGQGYFETELDSVDDAIRTALRGTTDFGRLGIKGQKVNQIIPFFNACIQGVDILANNLANPKTRNATLYNIGKYLVVPAIGIWVMNHEKDWWKESDRQLRYSNWLISEDFRVPVPQEAGVLFSGLTLALLDRLYDNDKKALDSWADDMRGNLLPNFVPTAISPILEWQANYSFFTHRNIVSQRLQKLPDELQYDTGTPDIVRGVGKLTGQSPKKIQALVRGYLATLGDYGVRTLDIPYGLIFGSADDGGAKTIGEYVGVRDFNVTDSVRTRYSNDFYDMLNEAQKQHMGYGKKGHPSKDLQMMNAASRVAGKLMREIRAIEVDKRYSRDQRRELIDQKKAKMNAVFKKAVDKFGDKYL